MPNTRRVYLNDNIRTEHLKCVACRTQIYLIKIEQERGGWETRTFGCPHCASRRSLRLAMPSRGRPALRLAEPVVC